ncbi:sulfotransferase family protein [Cohnella suwonensis]|uniref:Sulfotransferase family protein n=1 Tax=Cohnella suwonensis TaxID=696072 RepID=A0ABW0LUW1_9BACL
MRTQVVCILGMHRSGTSLITRAVKSLGVYLGEDQDFVDANFDNPEGFWERKDVILLNERILSLLGATWDTTATLPDDWWESEEIALFHEEMQTIIREQFHTRLIWGWKDPRTCLTIPLWISVLSKMEVELKFIIPIRNPVDVASSLEKRNNMKFENAMGMWNLHTLSALYYTSNFQRIIVNYDRFIEEPTLQINRLASFLGIQQSYDFERIANEIVNLDLRHKKTNLQELILLNESGRVQRSLVEIYSLCLELSKKMDWKVSNEIEKSIGELYKDLRHWSKMISPIFVNQKIKMQLFWKQIDEDNFTEEKSQTYSIDADGHFYTYIMRLTPNCNNQLRLDPTNRECWVSIKKLCFVNSTGYHLDLLQNNHLYDGQGIVRVENNGETFDLICTCNDPQLLIQLPSEITNSGGELILEMAVKEEIYEIMNNNIFEKSIRSLETKIMEQTNANDFSILDKFRQLESNILNQITGNNNSLMDKIVQLESKLVEQTVSLELANKAIEKIQSTKLWRLIRKLKL